MKPVDQSFESLNSEVIYVLFLCNFLNVESISLLPYGRLAEYSVLHLIYTNAK